jgi:hypothetical protein
MINGVTISHRGARYEIGRARRCYAIWETGTPRSEPLERWPETSEGWSAAWLRFVSMEAPGTIAPARILPVFVTGSQIPAAALLVAGVACGIAGLFLPYLSGASIAQQPAELVPHVVYMAVWGVSAAAVLLGGVRQRTGALLAAGTSIVTFGLFFADAGTVMAEGTHVMGTGLVLALVGWIACAAGSAMAFRLGPAGGPGRPLRSGTAAVALLVLAAAGAAATFAPSWDSYLLRTPTGQAQTVTVGNAFANPVPVIAGDVVVMVALVAAVAAAALWRPARQGAVLLAGAIIPMAAQAASALVQVRQPTSPAQLGISPAQAAAAGLTISNGLTPAFWIFCAFVITLAVSCAWLLITPPHAAATSHGSPLTGTAEARNSS